MFWRIFTHTSVTFWRIMTSQLVKAGGLLERGLPMKVTKLSIAITFALFGLILLLPSALAEEPEVSGGEPIAVQQPGQLLDGRYTLPASGLQTAALGIHVVASATSTCGANESSPVAGARVIVFTPNGTFTAFTGQTGETLFGAVQGPAYVQIEWPAGFIPCPDSPITVELPDGTGDVTFSAIRVP